MPLLKKERPSAAIERACQRTANILLFCHPHIPHAVAVMVMVLAFHTKNQDGVEDTLNIFLFPGLSPLAETEAASSRGSGTQSWGRYLDFLGRHESTDG